MKIKILKRIILITMTAALATGCQLAQPNAAVSSDADALIGGFITREHLELGDLEAYFKNHPEALVRQNPIYPNEINGIRVYADLIESEGNPESGNTLKNREYVFKDLAGIPFFIAQMKDDSGDSYTATHTSEPIQKGNTDVSYGDTEVRMVLTGTVYYESTGGDQSFYVNPVYQSPDGRVYLTAGSGISTSPGPDGTSGIMSKQLDSTVTTTQNGQTMTTIHQIKISFEVKRFAQKIRVLQMDGENRLIHETEIDPLKLPEDLSMDSAAAYLILEETTPNQTGKLEIIRSIINSESESFLVNKSGEFGTVVTTPVMLNWSTK